MQTDFQMGKIKSPFIDNKCDKIADKQLNQKGGQIPFWQ